MLLERFLAHPFPSHDAALSIFSFEGQELLHDFHDEANFLTVGKRRAGLSADTQCTNADLVRDRTARYCLKHTRDAIARNWGADVRTTAEEKLHAVLKSAKSGQWETVRG